jgi:putative ABC transport system permease protein
MRQLRAWLIRFGGMFRTGRRERELAEELESHLQLHMEDNLRAGMSAEEARRQALIKLGGLEQTKELYRERRGLPGLEHLLQDLRYGARTLRKAPGFTAVAVITLALGIGANTAIFSAVNAALLRPLPYHDPSRLVWVTEIWPKYGNASVPSPDYASWNAQAHSFVEMAAYDGGQQWNLTGAGEAERIQGVAVSANFFHLLGIEPALGRDFLPQEALPGGGQVAILSHALWQRRFGADPKILGKAITLDNQKYAVIGVMPSGFRFPDRDIKPEVFGPFQLLPRPNWYAKVLQEAFVIGRLRPGIAPEQGRAELTEINQRDLARVSPPFVRMGRSRVEVQIVSLQRQLTGDVRPALLMLLAAVGFVLLIACANVANLQMVHTAARRQELAVRAAIGAGRSRLIRQLLTEGAMLGCVGGALGLALGPAGIRLLRWWAPSAVAQIGPMDLDTRVLVFTLSVTAAVTMLFAVAPALSSSKFAGNENLQHAGARLAGVRGGGRIRKLLATTELAAALVLLIGAGLLLRSFTALVNIDPGFNPHGVLTARLSLPETKYGSAASQSQVIQRLLRRLSGLPGVKAAGVTDALPLDGNAGTTAVRFENEPSPPPGAAPSVAVVTATPDFFRAMRIPLLAGRFFNAGDGTHNDYPLIVNSSFAHRFFGRENPIGKRVRVGAQDWPWRTIVGVIGDVRQLGISQPAQAEIFRPYTTPASDPLAAMEIGSAVTIVLRSSSSPLGLATGVRQQLAAVDAELPISDVATMEQRLANELAGPRFNTTLAGLFAALALLLAMIGVYGAVAYFAAQRTHEIGIRMALGAMPKSILRLVLGEALGIVLVGVAAGVGGALGLSRYLASLLFATPATDPLTFATVSMVLAAVAVAASYFPARRAMQVSPMAALRYD